MRIKRYNNPLHQALEAWNRLPQSSARHFGLSLALDSRLRVFQYKPGRLKLAPRQILTLDQESSVDEPLYSSAIRVFRHLHSSTKAPVVFFLRSVSTLLGAHYWLEAGSIRLLDELNIQVSSRDLVLRPGSTEGALLVDGEGLFVWGQALEPLRDRLEHLDFQLDYQLKLMSLPEPRSSRGPILDGGWRLPPLPHARTGIFSI